MQQGMQTGHSTKACKELFTPNHFHKAGEGFSLGHPAFDVHDKPDEHTSNSVVGVSQHLLLSDTP
jgi:hypothetical protein